LKKTTNKKEFYNYLKFSSLAFEMMATVFLFLIAGYFADNYFAFEKRYFTIGLTISGLALALYNMFRKLL